jgi:uncharacterized protein YkwD
MGRGLARSAPLVAAVVALSVVVGMAPEARAEWTPRHDLVTWMNAARANHGARPLDRVWVLRELADDHSRAMAREGSIFHTTNLATRLRIVSWDVYGENVGVTDGLRRLFEAFMDSPAHRANILDRRFGRVGIGIYRDDHGYLWVTLIFVG